MREINVSRAGDPVHAGDKALTRETPTKRGRVNRYANRDPECVVYRIILQLRSTLNFGQFPKFKTYQCGHKADGRIREKAIFFIFCN